MEPNAESVTTHKHRDVKQQITVLMLLVIVLLGAYFRLINLEWDEGFHLHPDERYLSMVLNDIQPVQKAKEYFDTSVSVLNPNNSGYTFFVYGTFPIFIIRYVGEWIGQTGYDPITLVGRQLSAVFDLVTVLLVFLIAYKLYNQKAGLIAAALYAFAVLPIQQSHFMTVDTFTNTFGMLTVLAAVIILKRKTIKISSTNLVLSAWKTYWPYLLFGIALGMATASKINAVSLALLLPLVELVNYFQITNPDERQPLLKLIGPVAFAAIVSFLTFRILQPYAFSGPGFLNLSINPDWWNGLKSLQAQSRGEVDFPPALQWTRRPATFALSNLLKWGVGLPWGSAAIFAWLGMGFLAFKRKQYHHLPLWTWSLLYFLWQGLAWVAAMRYLLLLYPVMAVISGGGLEKLISRTQDLDFRRFRLSRKSVNMLGAILTILVLLGTAAWAFAFTRIYTRPVTRVSATDWIYANVEGPINLSIDSDGIQKSQPVQYRAYTTLVSGQSLLLPFKIDQPLSVFELTYPTVQVVSNSSEPAKFQLQVLDAATREALLQQPLTGQNPLAADGVTRQPLLVFPLDGLVTLQAGKLYLFELTVLSPETEVYLSGVPTLNTLRADGTTLQEVLPKINEIITTTHAYSMRVSVLEPGLIQAVEIPFLLDVSQTDENKTLKLTLISTNPDGATQQTGAVTGTFLDLGQSKGSRVIFELEQPLEIKQAQDVDLLIEMVEGEGQVMVSTPGVALESPWDDALPLNRPGYLPYADGAGLYRGDLNFEMYWTDDANKLARFYRILDQADYIFISSNRQFGTIPRVPERYPMSTLFYRALLGCAQEVDTLDCYYQAVEGQTNPEFGFDLVKTFTSYPNLGPIEFNDQYAEEAFSVYDHPKVLIFKKNASYDSEKTYDLLSQVDLSKVVALTPKQADSYDADEVSPQGKLMLSEEQRQVQAANGTWSEIFDQEALVNKSPWIGVLVIYLFFFLLGILVFPVVRLAFPGLKDKGYAFSRITGLLLFTLIAFNLGSLEVPITRQLLLYIFLSIAVVSLLVSYRTRNALRQDLSQLWRQFLIEEVIFLLAFAFFLWIRYQNPDLWHPWRGGEKPMDFSYLNAVIKSTTFPAYDPWFAGGYINYYYYGQVLVALPIKLLGVVPAIAYNILLPIWYAMLVLGAFSIGWNFGRFFQGEKEEPKSKLFGWPFWAGIGSAFFLALIGNLAEIKLISDGFKVLGSGGLSLEGVSLSQELAWLFKGIGLFAQGNILPIATGSWYWNPSRTIPGEPITEFPFFTFLYADFHAHLIAMPIVMAAIAWGLSLLMMNKKWPETKQQLIKCVIPILFFGSIVIGALEPTNTWDYLTFMALNLCIILYVAWRYLPEVKSKFLPAWTARLIWPSILAGSLFVLSKLLYLAFNSNFFPGYSSVGLWTGPKTPLSSYFLHWGLILFLISFWFAWETYQWMQVTHLSDLKRWEKYRKVFLALGALIILALVGMLLMKITIVIVAIPLCAWALFLILVSEHDGKKFAYFMIGTGLLLTIIVELVYLVGDIGRMNVVFKLYHQAWMLLTLPIGLAATILWRDIVLWRRRTQNLFQIPFIMLVFIGLLFPVLATKDKIIDRMSPEAPHTLDGMKYMESSFFYVNGVNMDLSQDYRAIQWLQENVEGSPVILEAQAYEYYWGNRFTIYTGLPGVVGWNYHQRQQRAILMDNSVQERVDSVNAFYQTQDPAFVKEYLERYNVGYIVVGQQEQAFYTPEGLQKFELFDGQLWDEVYREADTVIYKVR